MKKAFFGKLAVFCFLAAISALSVRASGEIDPAFAPVPSKALVENSITGQLVQPDGKIVVWGTDLAVDSKFGQIVRLSDNGTADPGFSFCGCLLTSVTKVVRQPDGKFLVGGSGLDFQGRIVRLNADGSHDSSFNSVLGGFSHIQSTADVIAVQADGRVFATIAGQVIGGFHSGYLVRLNSDGSVDTSFTQIAYDGGRIIFGYVRGFELDPNGRFYMAIVTFSAFSSSISLRRYAPDGTVDTTWEAPTFGPSGSLQNIGDLALQPGGALLVSGTFTSVNGVAKTNLVRILPAGNVDLNFTATVPGIGGVGEIAILQNGKILATAAGLLVRLNADGSTDSGFTHPVGITSVANRFVLDSAERIVAYAQSGSVYRLFRLQSNGPVDTGFNPNLTILAETYTQAVQSDGKLIVAGTFSQINGTPKSSIGRLNSDGTLDGSFDGGTGFDLPPISLSVQNDGKIIAAGGFNSYNGISLPGLARLNNDGSLDQTFTPTVASVYGATVLSDGKILIYGPFTTVNGVTRERLVKLNGDGSLDNSVTASIANGAVYSAVEVPGGGFVVGGSFNGVDGFNRSNLVRLNSNGSLDQTFNATGVATVNSIIVQPDGKFVCVYGAGSPSAIGRRNTDGSNDTGFVSPTLLLNGSSDQRIHTVTRQSDGSLLLGGLFDSVNNSQRSNIIRLAPNGSLDRLFLPRGANAPVRSMVTRPDGKVYVAGDYSRIGDSARAGLALVTPGAFTRVVPFDFDGDGRSDIAVFRTSENKWYILRSSDWQVTQTIFAIPGDRSAPADFDGDGKTDVAIYRPSLGDWWSLSTASNTQVFAHLGASGDIPLPSDISGDGRADYVVYRPSNFIWYRSASSNGAASQWQFGAAGDKPVIGDVDGDGKTEPVIFRPSTGDWWWQSSIDNVQRAVHWGIATDVPAAGDYDGDGKTDFAVYRPSEGNWYIRNSSNDSYTIIKFGIAEDKPVPADYDGDGRIDIAVYRPSTGVWYLLKSTEGFAAYQFGIATDFPVQNAFVP
ncbi:MAG: VCBS repeat-containing protein [Acidobacteria bacterium]|nr:VCBS repeat-containing protein [Acidobacteriota bacterium]